MASASTNTKRELIPFANACHVTHRATSVLKAWAKAGCFREGEWVVDKARTQGTGHPIYVDLAALEREHKRHGGTVWHPELAHERNLPASMATYVESLQAQVRSLEAELARLKQKSGTSAV